MSDKMLKAVLLIGFIYSAVMLIIACYPILLVYHTILDSALDISAVMQSISK